MRRHIRCCMLPVFLFPLATVALGDDARPTRPPSPTAAIQALIDDQTIVIARADLTRLPVGEVFKSVTAFLPDDRFLRDIQPRVGDFAKAFTAAGGRELYLVVSLADVPGRPAYFLAQLAKGPDERRLIEAFELLGQVRERVGTVLFAGSRETLDRLRHTKAADRPEIDRAFDAVEGSAAQLLVLPTADARRVIEELQPTLPAVAGGGPSTLITRGALWLSIGFNRIPHPSARLVIQSQDHAAAAALHGHWDVWQRLLTRMAGGETAPRLIRFGKQLTPEVKDDRLLLELDAERLEQLRLVLQPAIEQVEQRLRFQQATNNLKQIGIAMHGYADAHKRFPPAAIYDDAGKPLLSWRVAVLPYLGQEALYKEFHLDEPWDGEHNARLIERMPEVYRSPGERDLPAGRTTYLVPVGQKSLFHDREGARFQDISDGTSNTLLAVETDNAHAVVWTKPDDWSIDAEGPTAELGSPYSNHILVLVCDGAVLALKWPFEGDALNRLVTYDGGEVVDISSLLWRGE